jgi:uncharacterized membrane protein YGL010W
MKTESQWLETYEVTHRHPVNIRLHNICVPAIFTSVLGVLWALPSMVILRIEVAPFFVALFLALAFYLKISFAAFALMLVHLCFSMGLIYFMVALQLPLLKMSVLVFILGWLGQFYGHKVERAKPAFLDDLFFLLIGPLWVMRKAARKFRLFMN